MGPREFHPGFWDKFPLQSSDGVGTCQCKPCAMCAGGGSVVVFFGSKAACPLQIGQRIWPQSLRHPAFPLWMLAILFLAPKAGEARRKERRKEVKREGRNWRKEPRKPASQEGRKKDALSVNIVYIKFHQVPNRPPFGTVVQFLQPTFRCPEWGMWKGLKMDTITRIDVASDTTMFSRVREVVRAAVFVGRRFSWIHVFVCVVLFCFVNSFVRSFDSLSVWLCLKMDYFVLRRFPDGTAFIDQTWKMGPCQKDSFVDSWAFHLQWIFCVLWR